MRTLKDKPELLRVIENNDEQHAATYKLADGSFVFVSAVNHKTHELMETMVFACTDEYASDVDWEGLVRVPNVFDHEVALSYLKHELS
jgi:hypothetical protein